MNRNDFRALLFLFTLLATALGAASAALSQPADFPGNSFARMLGRPPSDVASFERNEIGNGVVHYRMILRVGEGPLDRVGLHRIVREARPGFPIRTRHALLLVHGANTPFEGTFLSSLLAGRPDDTMPTYLARRDIDVWGIDLRWTLLEELPDDPSVLADWGMARDRDDVRQVLSVIKRARRVHGHRGGSVDLLGFSWGARVGYSVLDFEAALRPRLRLVDRFIALDGMFKTSDAEIRDQACIERDAAAARIASGEYAFTNGRLAQLGELALSAPDEPSTLFPGFTNFQVAVLFGTQPTRVALHIIHAFAPEPSPGIPTGLRFTDTEAALQLLASASGWTPVRQGLDLRAVLCDDGSTDLDHNLGQIENPVLLLAAGGGYGENGVDTFPFLTSSRELRSSLVSLEPPTNPRLDVGHADILMMQEADELIWPQVFEWVVGSHPGRR